MLSFPSTVKIYLAVGTTDMRKSYDTLAGVARTVLEQDPFSGHVFAFCGRRRDRVKILYWDSTGFWLFSKRLARGTFAWPDAVPEGKPSLELRAEELMALVGGLDLSRSSWRGWVRTAS
jgi:transposase